MPPESCSSSLHFDEVDGFACRTAWWFSEEHLLRHCSRVVQQDGIYQCYYSRCSGRSHSALEGLKTHVELSHLSRMSLPCLARGCNEVFVRFQQLQSHFEHAHHELLADGVSVDALAPLAILAPPFRLSSPPLLPEGTLTTTFLAFVSKAPFCKGHSQASASQSISRKWSRLNVQDEDSDDDNIIAFDNLPSFKVSLEDMLAPKVVDVEVRRELPLSMQQLLSRPQSVIYPSMRPNEPKESILYPAFVQMVDDLVVAGTPLEHKAGGM